MIAIILKRKRLKFYYPNGARRFSTYDGVNGSSALNPSGLFNSGYSNFELGGEFAPVTSIRADFFTMVYLFYHIQMFISHSARQVRII